MFKIIRRYMAPLMRTQAPFTAVMPSVLQVQHMISAITGIRHAVTDEHVLLGPPAFRVCEFSQNSRLLLFPILYLRDGILRSSRCVNCTIQTVRPVRPVLIRTDIVNHKLNPIM